MAFLGKVKNAWNAFKGIEESHVPVYGGAGIGTSYRPDRTRISTSNEQSIVSSIHTRIAIDVSGLTIRHAQLDEQKRYIGEIDSRLNDCLTIEPNLDQNPRSFRQDIVMTMLDHGAAVIVPVDTTLDPRTNEVFDIHTVRVGYVTQWLPKHVRVSLYNVDTGQRQEITLEKRFVSIVENPLFAVMNGPNSTLQRLKKKLAMLDIVDDNNSTNKLDMIIQLPYVIKSEARRQQAEQRREDIEFQLNASKYGIAYTDGAEKITQLNRAVENNLMPQIEYLQGLLYSQLGITEAVMDGTADEKTMLNYMNRTVEPILDAMTQAMNRTFLGVKGVKRGEKIMFFSDPFKLVPLASMADIIDKFTRNEVITSNEVRGFIGLPPSADPKADQLVNSNINPHSPSETEQTPTDDVDLVEQP